MIKITVTSVFVEDQAKALDFYTRVLGFLPKTDVPAGGARWLTVVSPADPDGVELLLEPNSSSIATTYQESLRAAGIPATLFGVDDLAAEYERLRGLGVEFLSPPVEAGDVMMAVLDDTCGNLIGISQPIDAS
ncbi:catechol 2,3-dioxygenase-like lactoylglutathione lyase family enzyme [Actinoalloteichus hoggarensis]|uniref:Glyoxalase/Bleomycin resistance protein/Dioxygenase superfamily protein n=1 Tax=Actinoalloteichus hoggarensis TaxID=1470176 RepID=A0A221W5P0_9PSEU|nr:VOC family protein [Actinoalloteichus hoggarensis]ASO21021.1 Glyoxalase/Bleomycin resistance protein/Dioxygenase superfamily protein [Actinoalloteichus hoggarensis]MBB5920952.1 catechol 2,3-dioxygenase-like lactoylglutathione lyase family enzyme [Actinoalloteichus hoggarensis]